MAWLIFFASSAVLVLAAIKLADYGDVISVRTRLGGMFVGTLLLAGATSLPELLTSINSLGQNIPNLAAGNMFGSNMFNMFLLAALDMAFWRARILRRVATRHALTAGLAILLVGLVNFFVLANIDLKIGWVGVDSLVVMAAYIVGVRLLRGNSASAPPAEAADIPEGFPSLRRALVGFAAATGVLVFITPWLVRSSAEIAEMTGLGTGFFGAAFVAAITSIPELVATVAAARIGAYDLAVGNLFGSNAFNMFSLGLTDFFYLPGRFFGVIDPVFALAGLLGLILTAIGLISNLARVERRILFVEVDALLLALGYFGGLYFLYARGIG